MSPCLVRYWGSYVKSARHARRIAAYFTGTAADGWRIHVVCCRPPDDPEWTRPFTDLGIDIVYLPRATGNFDVRCMARTYALCRRLGADVFHCDNTHTSPLIGAALAGVKVRLWSKRSMEPAFEAGRSPGLRDRLAISLRVSCALATRTLPVSEMVGQELVGRGIPAARIQVLRSAIEPGESQPAPREEARARLGYHEGDFVVATVGRADPVKGWDVLLRAFAETRRALPHARLLLAGSVEAAGEQPFHGDLLRLAAERGLVGTVRFTGRLPTVADVLGAADLFVLPSRSEGHSLALVEAIRAGLPCVASAVGGAPELIDHGVNGMLVPRGDARALSEAIVLLGRDEALRVRLAAAGRAGLRMPTPDEHAQALQNIYLALLRSGDSARFVATT